MKLNYKRNWKRMQNTEKPWFLQGIDQQKLGLIIILKEELQNIELDLTKYNLQATMGGDIQEFIDELQLAENAEKLKEGSTVDG